MGHPAPKHDAPHLRGLPRGELGPRTRLVREALDQLLTPRVRDRVLEDAGWSETRDGPADASIGLREWVDTELFVRLVDKTMLSYADELRRHVRELIAKTEPPPARSVASSGVRPRLRSEGPATRIPCAPASSVLLFSACADTRDRLSGLLGSGVQLVAVTDVAELAATLAVLAGRVSLVLMDRRDRDPEELRALGPDALRGHEVVVWGAEPSGGLSYGHLLERCERSVGCSEEAALSDVARLCAALLGVS